MPNDAKLGLVLGMGLVVMIGMVYFRADSQANGTSPPPAASANTTIEPTTTGDIPILDPNAN